MNLKAVSIGILLFAVAFLAGCSKEISSDELYLEIIKANSELNSYSADLSMSLNMVAETPERKMNMSSIMETSGYINREDKRGYMKGEIKSVLSSPDLGNETGNFNLEIESETYIIDNYIYSKTMGMWLKMKLNNDLWLRQDAIESNLDLLKNSSINILDDESFNRNSYYVIELKPSIDALISALSQQEQLGLSEEEIQSKMGDMIKEYSLKMWINKKTKIVEKSETSVIMLFNPETAGKDETNEPESIRMDYVSKLEIYDINKEVEVTLPAEAEKATDMSFLYDFTDQDSDETESGSSITGNVIAEALRS